MASSRRGSPRARVGTQVSALLILAGTTDLRAIGHAVVNFEKAVVTDNPDDASPPAPRPPPKTSPAETPVPTPEKDPQSVPPAPPEPQ
jgi:hypothetical protein